MTVISFPSSRALRAVRVERERDGDGWITLWDATGWLHGDFHSAFRDAQGIARGYSTGVTSSAGRIFPC